MGTQLTVEQMLSEVAKYQLCVHHINYMALSVKERMQLMRDYVLGLDVEQVELLQELPWKPWGYAGDPKDLVKTREIIAEWVDGLFFLIDQALVLGITAEDISETFFAVLTKNYARKNEKTKGVPV